MDPGTFPINRQDMLTTWTDAYEIAVKQDKLLTLVLTESAVPKRDGVVSHSHKSERRIKDQKP